MKRETGRRGKKKEKGRVDEQAEQKSKVFLNIVLQGYENDI